MAKKRGTKTPLELGRRERQIFETLEKIGECYVQEVLDQIAEPPSYSSVRTMLNVLVRKGWAAYRKDGRRFLYRPAQNAATRQRSYVKQMLEVCFSGKPDQALMALLDFSASELTENELDELGAKIAAVRQQKANK